MSVPRMLSWKRVSGGGLQARPEANLSYLIRRHRVSGGTDAGWDLIIRHGTRTTTSWAATQGYAKAYAEMNYNPATFGLPARPAGLPS